MEKWACKKNKTKKKQKEIGGKKGKIETVIVIDTNES